MSRTNKLILGIPLAFFLISAAIYFSGYRINTTPSLPVGIYRLLTEKQPSQNARGDTIGVKKDNLPGLEQNRVKYCNFLIKQILGMQGDVVELDKTGKHVKINGKFVSNMFIFKQDLQGNAIKMSMKYPCTIPEGFVFVGTNCIDGYDSRYFGLVPESEIIGKMRLVYAFK